jgi:HsdM N-terminal domain
MFRAGLRLRVECVCTAMGHSQAPLRLTIQKMTVPINRNTKPNSNGLDVPALESWLWDAAFTIRGPLDAPKFKDYILPLIFLKRLSGLFDDEIAHLPVISATRRRR